MVFGKLKSSFCKHLKYCMKFGRFKFVIVFESHTGRGAGRVTSECSAWAFEYGVDCHGWQALFKAKGLTCNSLLVPVMPLASLLCL